MSFEIGAPDLDDIATSFDGHVSVWALRISDGEVIERAARQSGEIASVGKIFICIECAKQLHEGAINPTDLVAVNEIDLMPGSGAIKYLRTPGSMCVEDLMTLMMSASDNVAANLLLDIVGIGNVNETLRQCGFNDLEVCDSLRGTPREKDDYFSLGNAHDLGQLMVQLCRGSVVSPQVSDHVLTLMSRDLLGVGGWSFLPSPLDFEGDASGVDSRVSEGGMLAAKAGFVSHIHAEAGLMQLPDGDQIAYGVRIVGGDDSLSPGSDGALAVGLIARSIYEELGRASTNAETRRALPSGLTFLRSVLRT